MAANPAFAAGKGGFFDNLLKGLKSKIGSKLESKNRVASVAAVRGKQQGVQANALYWKGGVSDKAEKKLAAEKQQLTDAVQLVVDGDNAGGKAALQKFLRDNPDSVYTQDAKEALANLPEEGTEQPAVNAAPAAVDDAKSAAPAAKKPAKPADDEDEE